MAIGELKMAKLRGKQKWKHCLTVQGELWALERELDSMSQKGFCCANCKNISKQLGRVRSIILRTHSDDQKTLKRWIKPAPNQEKLKRQGPAQIKEKRKEAKEKRKE